jgi:hypothetical protein
MSGFGGADRFVLRAGQPGYDVITDFGDGADVAALVGFGAGFDPLAHLSQEADGTVLDLGADGQVLFFGRLVNEFAAEVFGLVA